MEQTSTRWHEGLIKNSIVCFITALAGICPLVYQPYCYHFNINLSPILNNIPGLLGAFTLFCIGPISFTAWVVGAFRGKPAHTLDALRSVVIGCLIAFWFMMCYVMRK